MSRYVNGQRLHRSGTVEVALRRLRDGSVGALQGLIGHVASLCPSSLSLSTGDAVSLQVVRYLKSELVRTFFAFRWG